MDSGFYAAMAGLVARTQALDSAAANLANAQTPGYRAEREYFRSVLLGPDTLDSQLGRTVNNFGLLGGNRLDLGQGALTTTGNALDLAIEGEGFFEIQTKSGSRFTRDGGFHRASTGDLVTVKGEPVLSDSGEPIQLPPGEVSVGADGVISVAGGVAARVGVFSAPSEAQITAEGANRYRLPDGVEPQASAKASVHQGAIESANQDLIRSSLDLIMMQRQEEMIQKALTVFHTEFNKIASEDLPKV